MKPWGVRVSIWKVNFSCEVFADFCYDHGVEKFHRLPCVCKFQVLSLFFATIKGNTSVIIIIIIITRRTKPCLLIDIPTPLDSKTSVKTKEKLNKYKDSEIEVERMWGLKTTTVPLVLGARGTIKKDRENYSNKIPGNTNIHELQKIALLTTTHLLRRVFSIK